MYVYKALSTVHVVDPQLMTDIMITNQAICLKYFEKGMLGDLIPSREIFRESAIIPQLYHLSASQI